eukprot:scaffold563097_cov24-Prasinocladus_malaysianus.AAC.1
MSGLAARDYEDPRQFPSYLGHAEGGQGGNPKPPCWENALFTHCLMSVFGELGCKQAQHCMPRSLSHYNGVYIWGKSA